MTPNNAAGWWDARGMDVCVQGPGLGAGIRLHVPFPFATVGRASNCNVRLRNEEVSRWHAVLIRLPEGVYFMDLGSRLGIKQNGAVATSGWLGPEQSIQMGPYTVTVEGEPLADPDFNPLRQLRDKAAAREFALEISSPKGLMSRAQLSTSLSLIGRKEPSTHPVHDPSIAPAHLLIYRQASKAWVINLVRVEASVGGKDFTACQVAAPTRILLGQALRVEILPGPSTTDDPSVSTLEKTSYINHAAAETVMISPAGLGEESASLRLLADLRQQVEAAKTQAEKHRQAADELRAQLETISEQHSASQYLHAESVRRIDDLKSANVRLQQELLQRPAGADHADLQTQQEASRAQEAAAQTTALAEQLRSAEQTRQEFATQVAMLQQENERLQASVTALQQTSSSADEQLKAERQQLDLKLAEQLRSAEQTRQEFTTQVAMLQEENKRLQASVTTLQQTSSSADEQWKSERQQLDLKLAEQTEAQARERKEQLQQLAAAQAEVKQLRATMVGHEETITSLRTKLDAALTQAETQQKQVTLLQDAQQRAKEWEARHQQTEAEHQQLQKQQQLLTEQLGLVQATVKQLTSEKQTILADREQQIKREQEIRRQLEARQELERQQTALIEALQQQQADADARTAELHEQLADHKQQAEQAQEEIARHAEQANLAQRQMAAVQEQTAAMAAHSKRMLEERDQIAASLYKLQSQIRDRSITSNSIESLKHDNQQLSMKVAEMIRSEALLRERLIQSERRNQELLDQVKGTATTDAYFAQISR